MVLAEHGLLPEATSPRCRTGGAVAMSLIDDARFSRLHTDPRFQRQPKKERKVVVDDRFSAMFNDSSFNDEAVVADKYGRSVPKKKQKNGAASAGAGGLQRLYDQPAATSAPSAAAPSGKKKKRPKGKAKAGSAPSQE